MARKKDDFICNMQPDIPPRKDDPTLKDVYDVMLGMISFCGKRGIACEHRFSQLEAPVSIIKWAGMIIGGAILVGLIGVMFFK